MRQMSTSNESDFTPAGPDCSKVGPTPMKARRGISRFCSALLFSVFLFPGPATADAKDARPQLASIVVPDTPTLIAPGIISTRMGEYSPTFDPGRNELYFMRRTPGKFDYTIYVSRFNGNQWSLPEVAPFSGQHRDAAPYLSPTGEQLFFDSRRPAVGLKEDSISLWRVRRKDSGWSSPELLREPSSNTQPISRAGADEFGPAVDVEGTLYFYSFRPPFRDGSRYIASADEHLEVAVEKNIPDPSSPTFVSYLYISPDGATAVMDGRSRFRNDGDIFFSCRQADGTWGAPLPLFDSEASEGGPFLTADGSMLLFSSPRETGDPRSDSANLYMMSTSALPVPCSD